MKFIATQLSMINGLKLRELIIHLMKLRICFQPAFIALR